MLLAIGFVGFCILYIIGKFFDVESCNTLVQTAKVMTGVGLLVGSLMWALVPEVISYGEWKSGKRIAGIVNALTGIFFKAGMTLGGIVAPAVLAYVAYNKDSVQQTPEAEEGILWLVCVIPAILLAFAMFIISRYQLTDEKIDEINNAIEERHKA